MSQLSHLTEQLYWSKDYLQRKTAARELGVMGDARAVDALIHALGDEDIDVRCVAAAAALGKIGDARVIEPLLRKFEDDTVAVIRAASEALIQMGPPAVESLLKTLSNATPYVRAWAADTLAGIGDMRALKPLLRMLAKDGSYVVRMWAAEALGRLGSREALPGMRARLRSLGGERDQRVRTTIGNVIQTIEKATERTKGLPRATEAETPDAAGRPRSADEASRWDG